MNEEILFEIPHLKLVKVENGKYCLVIEDTEVCDFVGYVLLDNYDIQSDKIEADFDKEIAVYYEYFESGFSLEILVNALQQIDANEIKRIYELNNKMATISINRVQQKHATFGQAPNFQTAAMFEVGSI